MRVGCVLIHNFVVQLARKDNPQLCGWPVILGGSAEANMVFDASPEAIACGVTAGMPLREGVSLCPEAIIAQHDQARCEMVNEQVLSILEGFSPTVESAGLGYAYLDLCGIRDEGEVEVGVA